MKTLKLIILAILFFTGYSHAQQPTTSVTPMKQYLMDGWHAGALTLDDLFKIIEKKPVVKLVNAEGKTEEVIANFSFENISVLVTVPNKDITQKDFRSLENLLAQKATYKQLLKDGGSLTLMNLKIKTKEGKIINLNSMTYNIKPQV